MSECINKYFIFNNQIKEIKYFDEKYIKEGVALYEVIRIIDGVPLYLERHLERLENSAKITNLKIWLSLKQVEKLINKLIKVNDIKFGNIKIIFNFNEENNFLIYFLKHSYPTDEMYEKGVDTIFYKGERENPNAKIIKSEFRKMVNKKIKEKNVYEAILVDRNDFITEGSKSNIFLIKGEKVYTAEVKDVLPGVTRKVIIEKCRELNIEVVEKQINYKDIDKFDAMFISGTSPKVLPIRRVENYSFNSSKNEILIKIKSRYDEDINNYILSRLRD